MKIPTILLVDDEPMVTAGLKRTLHREPWHILEAFSGESALETLRREPVDVVISDEAMPGMAGSLFLAEVRRQYPGTIRIMLSGQARLQTAVDAVNQGEIYRFFLKPCRETDLLQGIRDALRIHALEAERLSLLRTIEAQSGLLKDLERENPGITRVDRDTDGCILIDDEETNDDLGEHLA